MCNGTKLGEELRRPRVRLTRTQTMSSSKANQSDAEEESDGSGSDGEEASWCVHTHTFFSPLSVVRAGTALDTF